MKSILLTFLRDEEGLETIEMVILLVVLVSIAFMFRKTIINWYNELINETIRPDLGAPMEGPSLAE